MLLEVDTRLGGIPNDPHAYRVHTLTSSVKRQSASSYLSRQWNRRRCPSALGARAVLVGPEGERDMPLASLYKDDGVDYLAKRPDERGCASFLA